MTTKKSTPCFLLGVSFFSGYVILSLELLGFRLLAPWFGNTIYVWGILIGLVLIALSAGYYVGGRIADRYPQEAVLFTIILLSSVYLIFISIIYLRFMQMFETQQLVGAALSSFVFFFPPMFMLSMVTPFLIKFLQKDDSMGTVAGTISCLSTAGSLAGTLVTCFLLIPFFGSHFTILANVSITMIVALAGLWQVRSLIILSSLPLFFIVFRPPIHEGIFQKESPYNLVTVIKEGHFIGLTVGTRIGGFDTYYDPKNPFRDADYVDIISAVPALINPGNALILGLAGGHSARQLLSLYPEMYIDGIEIDPVVIDVAEKYYDLRFYERIAIIEDDARPYLSGTDKKYDFVEVDIFHGDVFVPFYLTTREFFTKVAEHMTGDGLMAINILDSSKLRLSRPISNTMASVFPSVFFLTENQSNYIYLASKATLTLHELKQRFRQVSNSHINKAIKDILENARLITFDPQSMILTDDFAPTDRLSFSIKKDWQIE